MNYVVQSLIGYCLLSSAASDSLVHLSCVKLLSPPSCFGLCPGLLLRVSDAGSTPSPGKRRKKILKEEFFGYGVGEL